MAVCQNLVPLVNIKIAGKWMFIPLKMVLIGIDPYPYDNHHNGKPSPFDKPISITPKTLTPRPPSQVGTKSAPGSAAAIGKITQDPGPIREFKTGVPGYIIVLLIGSMVLLYMVTWIPSIYPQC